MSDTPKPIVGAVTWRDLTVPDAAPLRDFYSAVVGWTHEAVSQGDYEDYSMMSGDGDCVAGICHARGNNAKIPPQWLVYINVEDVDASVKSCRELGGEVLDGPRGLMGGRFAVIKDPAGAVCAIFQAAAD